MLKKKVNINFILSLVFVAPIAILTVLMMVNGIYYEEFVTDRTGFYIKCIIILSVYVALLYGVAFYAWKIFDEEGSRLREYRILMGIEYELQIIIIGFLGAILRCSVPGMLIWVIPSIMVIYSAINTYTKRIFD